MIAKDLKTIWAKRENTFDQIEKFKSTGVYFINQTNYTSGLLFRYGVRYDENRIGTDSEAFISLNKFNPSLGFHIQLANLIIFTFLLGLVLRHQL